MRRVDGRWKNPVTGCSNLARGGAEWIDVQEVHDGVVEEGSGSEGEQEDCDADDSHYQTAAAEAGFDGNLRMTHGRNQEEGAPEDPAHPEDCSGHEKHEGEKGGKNLVNTGRNGVEDVSPVQLTAGDEVQ